MATIRMGGLRADIVVNPTMSLK